MFNNNKVYLFDGAMGTMTHALGLVGSGLPEQYNLTHPDAIESIHRAYVQAGADIIITNTLGANELNLAQYGLNVEEVITSAVRISRRAAGNRLVALDIGPVGRLMAPMGDLTFERAYDLVSRQVKAGLKAGADLVIIETLSDIYEAKAAVLAVKENSNLPVVCTLTFEQSGKTLMGTDPLTAVTVLEGLGVDALGANCSLGPFDMIPIAREFLKYSHTPVIIQPNAGLPKVVDGKPVYNLSPGDFAKTVRKMVEEGVRLVGGCCGTNPDFIKALKTEIDGLVPAAVDNQFRTAVASSRKTVIFDEGFKVIGERINPAGKEFLINAFKNKEYNILFDEAFAQKNNGADIIDINAAVSGTDEAENMTNAISYLQSMIDLPLSIDSSKPDVLSAGARVYNGKPLINSVNGKESSLHKVLPLVKKYGAVVVGMTLDEGGIPELAKDRLAIAKKILSVAEEYNISRHDIIIDCITESHKHNKKASAECLKAATLIKKELGLKTILGISNISYGFKNRAEMNSLFLSMAIEFGLDAAILDPCSLSSFLSYLKE